MADSRCWSKTFVAEFINLYKQLPCLWRVKSKGYNNKSVRNVAYDQLVSLCKPLFPEANRDFVAKKIQSLRGAFRKELKKVLHSKLHGASGDEVYVPTLWYYKLLLFTIPREQEAPGSNVSNMVFENYPSYAEEEIHEDDEVKIIASTNGSAHDELKEMYIEQFQIKPMPVVVLNLQQGIQTAPKRKRLADVVEIDALNAKKVCNDNANQQARHIMNEERVAFNEHPRHTGDVHRNPCMLQAMNFMNGDKVAVREDWRLLCTQQESHFLSGDGISPNQDLRRPDRENAHKNPLSQQERQISDVEEQEAVGIMVAKKLQRMDPLQAIYAESIINSVLKRGLLKTLGPNTDLCDSKCKMAIFQPAPLNTFSSPTIVSASGVATSNTLNS